ncbi:hypothetical protein H6G96_28785 [Nostoc sp. FACHB-892]|uniref:hypothetical protein n=1 Tax=Nostoc sp. FACHB-892 TaxID=2692843 RepID=UPI001687B3F6|nr:hypothetical protein [Nostoc sp. FACHB-892]MBD2730207.1 hypothetical protein [Nostoc sp. FACHB-892]
MKGLPSKGFSFLILCNFIKNWYNVDIDLDDESAPEIFEELKSDGVTAMSRWRSL